MPLYPHRHLLALQGLEPPYIAELLDLAESYALLNRGGNGHNRRRFRSRFNLRLRNSLLQDHWSLGGRWQGKLRLWCLQSLHRARAGCEHIASHPEPQRNGFPPVLLHVGNLLDAVQGFSV